MQAPLHTVTPGDPATPTLALGPWREAFKGENATLRHPQCKNSWITCVALSALQWEPRVTFKPGKIQPLILTVNVKNWKKQVEHCDLSDVNSLIRAFRAVKYLTYWFLEKQAVLYARYENKKSFCPWFGISAESQPGPCAGGLNLWWIF